MSFSIISMPRVTGSKAGVGRNPPASAACSGFGGASQARKQVMIIRVDGTAPAREIGKDADAVARNHEAPRLRVVARSGEGCVANDFQEIAPARTTLCGATCALPRLCNSPELPCPKRRIEPAMQRHHFARLRVKCRRGRSLTQRKRTARVESVRSDPGPASGWRPIRSYARSNASMKPNAASGAFWPRCGGLELPRRHPARHVDTGRPLRRHLRVAGLIDLTLRRRLSK